MERKEVIYEMVDDFMVIDGHVHTFMSDEVSSKIRTSFNRMYSIEFKNPGTGTIDDVLENMNSFGIDYTIMANFAPTKILNKNNKWTLDTSKNNPTLIPLVSFHPDMEEDFEQLFEEYLESGAKGVKLHPMAQGFDPRDPRLKCMYQLCNEISLPVVFHCGRVANARLNEYSDVDTIEPLIKRYRNIPFILTHMADGSVRDVLRLSQQYKNVYFDTSIVITGYSPILETNEPSWIEDTVVEEVVEKVGAERLIFGSDYPWGSPGHDLKRFLSMKLRDEQRKMILGQNSERLFLNTDYM